MAEIDGVSSQALDTTFQSVDDLRVEIPSKLDLGSPDIADTAMIIAADYPGVYNINQVSAIYKSLASGGWYYYSDPNDRDYFQNANLTLQRGKIHDSIGSGDCDDFAILMASLINSLGGSTRITFAYDIQKKLGHAYAEIYLGSVGDPEVDQILSWLEDEYGKSELPGVNMTADEVWLNLDWGSDPLKASYPGSCYFGDDSPKMMVAIISKSDHMTPPKIVPLIDGMETTSGWEVVKDDKGSSLRQATIPRNEGNASQITYELKVGGFVGISREIDPAILAEANGIKISCFVSGPQSTIQLRINCNDGNVFGVTLSEKRKETWSSYRALYSSLVCQSLGCNRNVEFNVSKAQSLEFRISNDPMAGDETGQGSVIIDQIQGTMAIPVSSPWARAENEKNAAMAGNLAEDSDYLRENAKEKLPLSVLLAIESLRRNESSAGFNAIREALRLLASSPLRLNHDDKVNAVALSPDGNTIATANYDGTVRIWNSQTGDELHRMYHEDDVKSVVFSSNSEMIATASIDNTSRIWNTETGEELQKLVHDSSVTIVVFSPDCKMVGTASKETVRIWDAGTGKEKFRFDHDWEVHGIAFSPDSKKLATAGGSSFVQIWDVESGEELRRLNHESGVTGVVFSPDGKRIATISNDYAVWIWDTDSGRELHRLQHEMYVNNVLFSPDGRMIATGSDDNTARIWDVETGMQLHRLEHETTVHAIAISPDGRMLATAIWGNTARIWNIQSGEELQRLNHEQIVSSIAFTPDGERIVTGGFDDVVKIWEVNSKIEMRELLHDDDVFSVAFSSDSNLIATSSWDCTAAIWNARTGKKVFSLNHDGVVDAADFSNECTKIATVSDDGTARIWDAQTGEEIHRLDHHDASAKDLMFQMHDVEFSPDGKMVATASNDETSRIWDVETGKELYRLVHDHVVDDIEFSPDGRWLATASWDNTARIWDTQTGQELQRLHHNDDVNSVRFSHDGKKIATASSDNSAVIWDPETGKEILRLIHDFDVNDVIFSPDGRKIVTRVWDEKNTARIWDANTGKELYRLKHDAIVHDIEFSPDGKRLATASNAVRIWDIESGFEIQYFSLDPYVLDLAFSPDGKFIATASGEKTARLWLWRSNELISEACNRIARSMTQEEWHQYLMDEPYRETCPCQDQSSEG